MQVDGVSMGSPLAPILADICMTHIEQQLEQYDDKNKIKICLRYVDDTFIIFNGKESDVQTLTDYANELHLKLKFTCETEKNYELPFLDVKVLKRRTKYETTVYTKETNTGQVLH